MHLGKLRDGGVRERAHGVVREIKHARQFVLNPHSHYDPEREDEITAEIADGIRAVGDFELLLRSLQKTDFVKPSEEIDRTSVGEMIRTAIEHLRSNRRSAALDTLSRAFEQHLDEFFRVRREMIPYATKVDRMFLFTWAGRQRLFPKPLGSCYGALSPICLVPCRRSISTPEPSIQQPACFYA